VPASFIILAAGESTRMGQQKALVEWQGVPLIRYHLERLQSIDGVAQVIVVTGHEPERLSSIVSAFPLAVVAHNPDYRTGKVSSILAGLRRVAPDATCIVILAVDQPRSADTLRRLLEAHDQSKASISVPTFEDHRGHPLIFDASLLPELLAINEATMGVRAVVERDGARVREHDLGDPNVLLDLNTPIDVQRAAARTPSME
jgi:molybdenum cofactor cytidylyltransferase